MPKVNAYSINGKYDLSYGQSSQFYNYASASYDNVVSLGTTYGIGINTRFNEILIPNRWYMLLYATSLPGGGCAMPSSFSNQFKAMTTFNGSNYAQDVRNYNVVRSVVYFDTDAFDSCVYSVVFRVSSTSYMFLGPMNSGSTTNGTWVYYGYYLEDLGTTDGVSNTSLNNSINNMNTNITTMNSNISTQSQNIQNKIDAAKNQAHQDAQDMQNTIKDDNVDSPNSSINTIKNYLATNGVITNLVTLPVTLYQSILNSVNSSCATFSLGSLYGTNLQIPCINVATYIGNTLWGTIDVIISGIFVYSISRKMVKVFNQLSSMKEGDVLDG